MCILAYLLDLKVKCPVCKIRHIPKSNDLKNDPCDKCRIRYANSFKVNHG